MERKNGKKNLERKKCDFASIEKKIFSEEFRKIKMVIFCKEIGGKYLTELSKNAQISAKNNLIAIKNRYYIIKSYTVLQLILFR